MTKNEVVKLIGETPNAHGVFDTITETERIVYCSVKSVGMNEAYQAQAIGLNPECKLVLAHDFEYGNERKCEFNGVLYKIIRTYRTETDGIELTIERMEGNADV